MPFSAFGRGLLAFSIVLATSGCASVVSDSVYPVSVTSTPSGARYDISSEDGRVIHSGVTPGMVTLDAGAGYFDGETYLITYRKDAYEEQQTSLDSSVDGWYWGNLVFGGILGFLVIDPATGAMYKLPNTVHASLPAQAAYAPMPNTPQVSKGYAGQQATGASTAISQEQQLDELARTPGLTYEEYQRRFRVITGQR